MNEIVAKFTFTGMIDKKFCVMGLYDVSEFIFAKQFVFVI